MKVEATPGRVILTQKRIRSLTPKKAREYAAEVVKAAEEAEKLIEAKYKVPYLTEDNMADIKKQLPPMVYLRVEKALRSLKKIEE